MTLEPSVSGSVATGLHGQSSEARRRAWRQHREEMIRLISAKSDWVPLLLVLSVFLSPEARLDLGGLQLYPYRLVLILTLPAIVIRASRNPIRVSVADIFIFAAASWIFVATAAHYPFDVAFKTGGANTLDAIGAYLAGRVFFRTPLDIRRFLYSLAPVLLFVAVLMFLESVSHRYILRPLVGSITGHSPAAILSKAYEIRNGFLRATGPFNHPISAGLFFASFVPLYLAANLPRRGLIGIAGCLGGIFSWSSAGLGTLAVGFLIGIYDYVQSRFKLGWMPIILSILFLCFMVEVLANGGLVRVIIRYASLNPQTGYFRIAIWDYGWADVLRHPWFGIGYFESYVRPRWMVTDSVDNYWLLLGLRYGIPCMLFTLLGVITTAVAIARSSSGPELGALRGRRMATGVCGAVVVIYLSIISVAPWGAELAWFTALLGIANGVAEARRRSPGRAKLLES